MNVSATSPLMPMANAAIETLQSLITTDPSLREPVMNSLWQIVTTQALPTTTANCGAHTTCRAATPLQTEIYRNAHIYGEHTSATAPYYKIENEAENQPAPSPEQARQAEATITQFLEELLSRAQWSRLPVQFMYDAYRAWIARYRPTSYVASKKLFQRTIKTQIPRIAPWWVQRTTSLFTEINYPEPLIAEWGVQNWQNPDAAPYDIEHLCTPKHPRVRGNVYVDSRRCRVYRCGDSSTHKKRGRPRKVTQTVTVNIHS